MISVLKRDILKTCFLKCDTQFASGQRANNKLDLERIALNSDLRKRVVNEMARLAKSYQPDFVVGVPQGANWLAADVASRLKVQNVVLVKNSHTKAINFATNKDKLKCQKLLRGIIIEDVFSSYTNTLRVLRIPQIAKVTVAAVSIWDRGLDEERRHLDIETKSLIKFHIQPCLSDDSELWQYVA